MAVKVAPDQDSRGLCELGIARRDRRRGGSSPPSDTLEPWKFGASRIYGIDRWLRKLEGPSRGRALTHPDWPVGGRQPRSRQVGRTSTTLLDRLERATAPSVRRSPSASARVRGWLTPVGTRAGANRTCSPMRRTSGPTGVDQAPMPRSGASRAWPTAPAAGGGRTALLIPCSGACHRSPPARRSDYLPPT
jgi:hypothetical protein